MVNVRGGGGFANSPRITFGTEQVAKMIIEHVYFGAGYPDEVADIAAVVATAAGTVDTTGITTPTTVPSIPDIPVSGAPADYGETIKHNTSWPLVDITVEAAPTLHVGADTRETAVDPSTIVVGSVSIPTETATDFSSTYTIKSHKSIPVPPDITITAYTNAIPEFTVTVPDQLLDWAYDEYTSTLLTTLKTQADELLTTPVNVSNAAAITRNAQVWDSPSYFLRARGINGLAEREIVEGARFKDNINRLITILEADYTERNKHFYVDHRQALENFERAMYDAKQERKFAYAKAWAENRLQFYGATIESYNQLLHTYRLESISFQETIENEKAKLADLRAEIEAYRKGDQIDEALIGYYLKQVEIVNNTIKAFEVNMSVSEAIANITLMSAEMDRLNAESFVLRARAIANAADANAYFDDTELMTLDFLDAALAYTKTSLEKSAVELERTIGMLEEDIDEAAFETEKDLYNTRALIEKNKATYWANIARNQLALHYARSQEERASALRNIEKVESETSKIIERLNAKITTTNDGRWKQIDEAFFQGEVTVEDVAKYNRVNEAEVRAAHTRAQAALLQTFQQNINEGTAP